MLTILSAAKPPDARQQRERKAKITDDIRYLSPSQKIDWLSQHLEKFRIEVQKTSNVPSGHLIYGKDTQKHIEALIKGKMELSSIKDGKFTHPGLDEGDEKTMKRIEDSLNETIVIHDIDNDDVLRKEITVWDAIYEVGAKYDLFGVSDAKHKQRIKTGYKRLGKVTQEDKLTLEWIEGLIGKEGRSVIDIDSKEYLAGDYHKLLLLYNEYEDIGSEMEEANLANNDKDIEELQIEEEEILEQIQEIDNQYPVNILEAFKERMAIPKSRLIDYTTTAGQVAERLPDRPDINITEE